MELPEHSAVDYYLFTN